MKITTLLLTPVLTAGLLSACGYPGGPVSRSVNTYTSTTQSVSTSTHTGRGGRSVRRTYAPIVRSSSPVVRRYSPVVRSSAPTVRRYSPVVRTYAPVTRTYSPVVRRSYSSPIIRTSTSRTYTPTVRSYSSPTIRTSTSRTYTPTVRSYSSPIARTYTSGTYTPTVRSYSSPRISPPVIRRYSPTKRYVSPPRYVSTRLSSSTRYNYPSAVTTTTPATRITIPSLVSTPTSRFIVPSTITTPATRTTYTRSTMRQQPTRRYTPEYNNSSYCPPPLPKRPPLEPDYCPPEPCCP
jgi:hypothetical protein